MSIHLVSTTATYRVADGSDVLLRITIGEGQGGGWIVAWDSGDIVAKGASPEPVHLGLGRQLRGRVLQVVATAVDIRPETNRLSRTLVLGGGPDGDREIVDRWDDGGDGDAAVFTTLIVFP